MKKLLFFVFGIYFTNVLFSQNVAITDDDSYIANPSAMLDIKSTSKGLLIPRLTTAQRITLSATAATGLLVYDTNLNSFMFWNGTSWTNLTSGNASGIWSFNSPNVYLSNTNYRVGVGTTSPTGKMEVKSDSTLNANDPIFHVVNKTGDTIFAVYDGGVRINVYDDPAIKASGNKGGFAVGGFTPSKGTLTNEYLRVTPDSVRIYIEENPAAKGNNNKGGFAVGGFTPSKVGLTNEYLRVTNDSTRIWTEDPEKGFGVRNIGTTEKTSYMQLTPDNYFIGHESGIAIDTGKYNSFFGYKAGRSTFNGNRNIFIGYESGYSNYNSSDNTFLGFQSGRNTLSGGYNVFIGSQAGVSNSSGNSNLFIGKSAGAGNTSGEWNIALGHYAGFLNTTQSYNICIGVKAGYNNQANENIYIGEMAGWLSTTPTFNTIIGSFSGFYNTTGGGNTFMGFMTGYMNQTGSSNTFLGTQAAQSNKTGSGNVIIGYNAGSILETGNNNIFIGANAASAETNSNRLYIANAAGTKNAALIYGEFDNQILGINAKTGIGTTTPLAGLDVEKATGNTFAKFGDAFPVYIVANYPNVCFNTYYNGAWKFGKGSSGNYAAVIAFDHYTGKLSFQTSNSGNADATCTLTERFSILQNGNVGIGTNAPVEKLQVVGNVRATSFIATTAGVGAYKYNTTSNMNVPDYVFDKNFEGYSKENPVYTMLTISELNEYILVNRHLPRVPSRSEIEKDGVVNLQGLSMINLEKTEENTLYIIQLNKKITEQQNEINELKNKINTLSDCLEKLVNEK